MSTRSIGEGIYLSATDPDGRPWDTLYGRSAYQAHIRNAIKYVALNQSEFLIPFGYLFDNPALMRLVLESSGSSDEAKALQSLLRETLRIFGRDAIRGNEQRLLTPEDILERLSRWLGDHSSRGAPAYLNIIPNSDSIDLVQGSTDPVLVYAHHLRRSTVLGTELDDYVRALAAIGPALHKPQPGSQLDARPWRFRDDLYGAARAATNLEPEIDESRQRLLALLEETPSDAPVSRSFLWKMQSREFRDRHGVDPRLPFTFQDYTNLVELIRSVFIANASRLVGCDAFIGLSAPPPVRHPSGATARVIQELGPQWASDGSPGITKDINRLIPSLRSISFRCLRSIRQAPHFSESISRIYSGWHSSEETFRSNVSSHWNWVSLHVAQFICSSLTAGQAISLVLFSFGAFQLGLEEVAPLTAGFVVASVLIAEIEIFRVRATTIRMISPRT